VAKSGLEDAYVRPVIWRGSEMMGISAQSNKINLAIACWAWPSYFSPQERMRGIKLKTADWRRPDPQSAPFKAKAAGLYMVCTLSKHAAEAEGFQDALMLDYRGLVAETTGANIFLVIDGKLVTPTPDCFLDGITRRAVIDLAKRRSLEVIERPVPVAMLDQATEVLVTGTAVEVTPVSRIDQRSYAPGRITETLMNDYMDLVNRCGPFAVAAE
jgi:branched-chain amino acid aminotransferase